MKHYALIAILTLSPLTALGEGYQVFGVRTDFPSADGEVIHRDVYVNMGTAQGIKAGSVLDAFRTVTTVDQINQKVGRNFTFKIAQLKVIHAEGDVAVARLLKMQPAEATPTGSFTNVMVGDRVEVAGK
jgi:hypothetical protein